MNINNSFVAIELMGKILDETHFPISLREVSKDFAIIVPLLFWERCQIHPSLKKRAHMIEAKNATFSVQKKISAFYVNLKQQLGTTPIGGSLQCTLQKSLKFLVQLEDWVKSANLIVLFNEIAKHLPVAKDFIDKLDRWIASNKRGSWIKLNEQGDTIQLSENLNNFYIFEDVKTIGMINICEKANIIRSWLLSNKDKLFDIKHLNLQEKDLSELPKEITLLKLTSLDLSHNNLVRLPPEISELTRLEKLVLDNNKKLSFLPGNLSQLPLQSLSIKNTQLIGWSRLFVELCKKGCLIEI